MQNHSLLLALLLILGISSLSAQHTLSETAQRLEKLGFVNVAEVCPEVPIDLMYTRADNFTGRVLYVDLKEAYLHPEAAKALQKAQQILQKRRPDLSLKLYDAARPMAVQQQMWNVVKGTSQHIYVSNPANGGGLHNYGLAVDVTLCTLKGDTIPMGTLIDHLGSAAHIDKERELQKRGVLSAEAVKNRVLLREVMRDAGYKALRSEWWHFNFKTRAEARANYQVIK